MKPDSLCVSFYGWHVVDQFMAAWRAAGLRPVAHLVFPKRYASRTVTFEARHEQAYVLAKGSPKVAQPIPDVLPWAYTGNRLHPTQKPVEALRPIIAALTRPGDIVLDPFAGSGSTLVAAQLLGGIGLGEQPRFEVQPGGQVVVGMGGPRKAIDAAVLAPAIGVDRTVERHIGRLVEGEDRLRPLLGHRGAQADGRAIEACHVIAPVAIDLARCKAKASGDRPRLRAAPFYA